MPSDLQRDMVHPERFLVAHPFNPVYLLPLVELVGGKQTSAQTLEAARRFFTYIGMHALQVRREVPGHLTDRLQEALWREILHMVNEDVATTGELDDSIIYGPGLRWAAMGTNLIYHLAGGETGMRHMLRQFGPCTEVALDQAGSARAHRVADRQDGRRAPRRRRGAVRSASSSGCATTIWSRSSRSSDSPISAPAPRCAPLKRGCTRTTPARRGSASARRCRTAHCCA